MLSEVLLDTSQIEQYAVHINVTDSCQLLCEHCFPDKSFVGTLFVEDLEYLESELLKHVPQKSCIRARWQGGEPTLAGEEHLSRLMTKLSESTTYSWQHQLHTNLIQYTPELSKLYKKHLDNKINVSWDYAIRKYKSTAIDYETVFWNNMGRALADGVEVVLAVTLTSKFIQAHPSILDFLERLSSIGIKSVYFQPLQICGAAQDTVDLYANYDQVTDWLQSNLIQYLAWKHRKDSLLRVETFNNAIDLFKGSKSSCYSQHCDMRYFTFSRNYIGANASKMLRQGCCSLQSIGSIFKDLDYEQYLDARHNRLSICHSCEVVEQCGGSCMNRTLHDESSECAGFKKFLLLARSIANSGMF